MTAAALDAEVRRDLRGLQKDTAESVARHLVAAGSLIDEDPELALEHARFARRRASRIAVVREAAGIAAYHAGEWAEALAELRAARRMGGGPVHVPVMADIERALGRPERAIDLARGPEAAELAPAERIELTIVAAGARRDLGEVDASVVALQIPELDPARRDPWSARLFYAYADNLLAAGRDADAVQWFVHAADADELGETDAPRRIALITGDGPEDDLDDIAFGEEDLPDGPVDASSADAAQRSPDAGHQQEASAQPGDGAGVDRTVVEDPVVEGAPAADAQVETDDTLGDAATADQVPGEPAGGAPAADPATGHAADATGSSTAPRPPADDVAAEGGAAPAGHPDPEDGEDAAVQDGTVPGETPESADGRDGGAP